jgi:hypothetical protein
MNEIRLSHKDNHVFFRIKEFEGWLSSGLHCISNFGSRFHLQVKNYECGVDNVHHVHAIKTWGLNMAREAGEPKNVLHRSHAGLYKPRDI